VRAKAEAALRAGLVAIICVGETRAERDGGETLRVVGRQIDDGVPPKSFARDILVAYEPVWAIGTGLVPSSNDVAEVHGFIRRRLGVMLGPEGERVRLLYGGSVKPANAKDLIGLANVDGVLVGGASLIARDFIGIAEAYR
jgi:triosephosphate isomerase